MGEPALRQVGVECECTSVGEDALTARNATQASLSRVETEGNPRDKVEGMMKISARRRVMPHSLSLRH